MDFGKKEQLIIGIGLILFVRIFDWSNYFLLVGIVFIVMALSNKDEEQSENNGLE